MRVFKKNGRYMRLKEKLLSRIISFLNVFFSNLILWLVGGICAFLLGVAVFAPSFVSSEFRDSSSDFFQGAANITATLYNSMSPFIAIVAALLTFIAFWVQHEANEKMLKNHERQEVERQFYEMLRIHKENVNELKWNRWSLAESSNPKCICENDSIERGKFFYNNKYAFKPIMGREVFEYLLVEFMMIEDCLKKSIDATKRTCRLSFNKRNIKDYKVLLNYAYKIFYDGAGVLRESFDEKMKFYFDACDKKFKMMKKIYDKGRCFNFRTKKIYLKDDFLFDDYKGLIFLYCYYFLSECKIDYSSCSFKTSFLRDFSGSDLFHGHTYELNHYYRHLYQMVKIVANYDELVIKYEEKRKYLKMLRAQLTSIEQLMLFYNWLSGYGGNWENEKNHFFTTYRMIHNMDIENCLLFDYFGYARVVKMIKETNKDYRAYKDDNLFEFEDVKIKKLTNVYDRIRMGNGPFRYKDLFPFGIARIVGLNRYLKMQKYVLKKYGTKWRNAAISKNDYVKAVTDIQNYIKRMFVWED